MVKTVASLVFYLTTGLANQINQFVFFISSRFVSEDFHPRRAAVFIPYLQGLFAQLMTT